MSKHAVVDKQTSLKFYPIPIIVIKYLLPISDLVFTRFGCIGSHAQREIVLFFSDQRQTKKTKFVFVLWICCWGCHLTKNIHLWSGWNSACVARELLLVTALGVHKHAINHIYSVTGPNVYFVAKPLFCEAANCGLAFVKMVTFCQNTCFVTVATPSVHPTEKMRWRELEWV